MSNVYKETPNVTGSKKPAVSHDFDTVSAKLDRIEEILRQVAKAMNVPIDEEE